MEDELWKGIYRLAMRLGKGQGVIRGTYSDVLIVAVYFWAVVHDRPNRWACEKKNWHGCGPKGKLPSPSQLGRRLRSHGVIKLIEAMERHLLSQKQPSLCRLIDAKPLPVSGHSEDPHTGYGRAASTMARGYKIHAVYDISQGFVEWALHPMNINECPAAIGLISNLNQEGYLIGDNAYDKNVLYEATGRRRIQLLAPQRKNTKGIGHHRHSVHRLRAIEMQSREFAKDLIRGRRYIETAFGQLTTVFFGLAPLPSWVRTFRRVRLWVQAKLILFQLHRLTQTTYVI